MLDRATKAGAEFMHEVLIMGTAGPCFHGGNGVVVIFIIQAQHGLVHACLGEFAGAHRRRTGTM